MKSDTLKGEELLKGFPLTVRQGSNVRLIVKAINP